MHGGFVTYCPPVQNVPNYIIDICTYQRAITNLQHERRDDFSPDVLNPLRQDLKETVFGAPHGNPKFYDYLRKEDDPRLLKDCHYILKQGVEDILHKSDSARQIQTLQGLHIKSKKQFEILMLDHEENNVQQKIWEINNFERPVRNDVLIDMAIGKISKMIASPLKCYDCMLGFESMDRVITHLRSKHKDTVDKDVQIAATNRLVRQTREEVGLEFEEQLRLLREENERLRNQNDAPLMIQNRPTRLTLQWTWSKRRRTRSSRQWTCEGAARAILDDGDEDEKWKK